MKFTDPEIIKKRGKLSLKQSFIARLCFLYIGIHGILFPVNTISQLCEGFRVSRNVKGFRDFIELCDLMDDDMFS